MYQFKTIFLLSVLLVCFYEVRARDPKRGAGGSGWIGGDIFLQGQYLEVGINPGGAFGSRRSGSPQGGSSVPAGFHPSSTANQGRLGVVLDWDKNGWEVGTPARTGDFYMENIEETGWHLSWYGDEGAQIFNQQPTLNDDDDADPTYTPARGCVNCVGGQIPNCFALNDGECDCPPHIPSTYTCPFKRWDIVTQSFQKVDMSGTSTPNQQRVRYVGVAKGTKFQSPTSGIIVEIGEEITVSKDIYFNYADTFVVEEITLTNSGTKTLNDVGLFWHAFATPEAVPGAPWARGDEEDYWAFHSIPSQGSPTNDRVLIQSRTPNFNWTLAMGTLDNEARAWMHRLDRWQANDPLFFDRRPYQAEWVFEDLREGRNRGSAQELYRWETIAIATKRESLSVGQSKTFYFFHAFTPDSIEAGFAAITPGCDGVVGSGKVIDQCGDCGGNNTCVGCDGVPNSGKSYDLCGVCDGNNACVGCDEIPNSGKVYDLCGVCDGNNTCVGCDGIPNSGKSYDLCGVCDGNNACVGCDGVPNSGKVYDLCGDCDGNNSSCTGCDGVAIAPPGIPAKEDACGECGGNNSTCTGCDGIVVPPPGIPAAYDECGVCNGPGKECLPPNYEEPECPDCFCEPCLEENCPPCNNPCKGFHGYDTTQLDFLVYRHEARLVLEKLDELKNTLGDAERIIIVLTGVDVSNRLDDFDQFTDCVHLVNTVLRDNFGLPI